MMICIDASEPKCVDKEQLELLTQLEVLAQLGNKWASQSLEEFKKISSKIDSAAFKAACSDMRDIISQEMDGFACRLGLRQRTLCETIADNFANIGNIVSSQMRSCTGSGSILPASLKHLMNNYMPSVSHMSSYTRDTYLGVAVTVIPIATISYWWYKKNKKKSSF